MKNTLKMSLRLAAGCLLNRNFWLLLLVAGLSSSCMSIKPVDFKGLQSYKMSPVQNGMVDLEAIFRVNNPNNFRLIMKKYEMEVLINNQSLGSMKSKQKIVIRKNAEDNYPLTMSIDYQKIMGQAMNSITSMLQGKQPDVTFRGKVRVKAFGICKSFPFEFKDKLKLPR